MRALCIRLPNPLDPLHRETAELRRPLRVRRLAPRGNRPVIALLNGRPLLRAGWRRRLRHGDVLVFASLPRGGGSNPLRLLASLAIMAFAPWAATGLLGASAGTVLFGGFTLGQATSLGIMFAGQALINAVMPMPKTPTLASPSPTYSLAAQGNQARIEQAIPVQYGRLLAYPDFAAQPYTEFAGGEQYLYQLLCLGAGEYEVEELRIEDTPVSAFQEIEYEVVPPGAQVELFPSAVTTSVEVSGQDMPGATSGSWSRSGSTITVTETAHGRAVGQAVQLEFTTGGGPGGVYAIATVAGVNSFTITVPSGAAASGAVTIRSVLGGLEGFVASAPESSASHLGFDLVLSRGLFDLGTSGKLKDQSLRLVIEARQIDANGDPLGSWVQIVDQTLTDRTTTPLRRSIRHRLAARGRYAVRAWRIDAKDEDAAVGHDVALAGLRAYLREPEDHGDVTLIALRMRATNNLSLQASRKIGVIATRKLPVWTGSSWTAPQASRSIAWAIADAARNGSYGARLPDSRIDLAALLALDAVWEARGDRFDGRFDSAASWWEAVARIARAGRARIFLQGGRLRVVRDGPETLPVALFSMRNIVRGSFAVDYAMPTAETADAVEVAYYDGDYWTQRRVTAKLPGSAGARPARIDGFGITGRDHALREGLYQAATNRYRRRSVRFDTEMEGFIPSIGDLIAVQHDMPAWGAHAEAVAWDAATRTLTVSEDLAWGAGQHYVGLRRADGAVSGPWPVSPGPAADQLVFATAPDILPYTGSDRERSHLAFGPGSLWAAACKVTAVRPKSLHLVTIEAVPDDPSVHSAETGRVAAPLRLSALPRRFTRPEVTGLLARRIPGDNTRVLLAWRPAAGAETYQIEMAEGDDPAAADVTWTRIADTSATQIAVLTLYAARTMVRVRGLGLAAGDWAASTFGLLIPQMWNTDPTPMWTAESNAMWST
ncbi:MAG: phage tail protein [Gemmobacter sp.]|nr:phage tail protein [Gemmobacter sp.]